MRQYLLTVDNMNANKVLMAIQNKPRKHVSTDNLTTLRWGKVLSIYEIIDSSRDYSVARWGDKKYSIHLRPLLSEEEWLQFKRDILSIYAEQNSKRAALRKLVQFNWYRSLLISFLSEVRHLRSRLPNCEDPLRDMHWSQRFLLLICLIPQLFAGVLVGYFTFMPITFICLLLDLLTFPRFILFHERHVSFLESVMEAHPDLDPALVEEELIQKMQQLAQNMTTHHPGVHCRFSSSLVHHNAAGSDASYDEDVVEIQFH